MHILHYLTLGMVEVGEDKKSTTEKETIVKGGQTNQTYYYSKSKKETKHVHKTHKLAKG